MPHATGPARGKGRAVLRKSGNEASFSELSYSYPLKLLSPQGASDAPVAIAYMMSYGGGLVSGDQVELDVDVGAGTSLLLLTQGSTKVFKSRQSAYLTPPLSPTLDGKAPSPEDKETRTAATTQKINFTISPDALLLLLPDPVTCFRDSSYSQLQTFHLEPGASAAILDWFTSGRMSRGEQWDFERYRSANEVFLDGKRIMRDVMLLESAPPDASLLFLPPRTLKDRLGPYACYATLLLVGPKVQDLIASLEKAYQSIHVFQQSEPLPLVWSMSALEESSGAVVRVAALETDMVRTWLRQSLQGLSDLVGDFVYEKAFV
ncbi:hypothetical protein BOTBODRAFT_34072 [Botryobasidium botryosum FD-172 SS1]|uniref:Urease accessory protein UreD n=1 Tax=Botryobasidium botryosum (strain FD-172 SS1) TaxID=930990 RepID=A0A067MMY8_BOTB1|nr:hypothetical protein BOTBODRAFT_34072 [Botryobasidium botryosum FD-172 SS1]